MNEELDEFVQIREEKDGLPFAIFLNHQFRNDAQNVMFYLTLHLIVWVACWGLLRKAQPT